METITQILCVDDVLKEQQQGSSQCKQVGCNTEAHPARAKQITRFTKGFSHCMYFVTHWSGLKCNLQTTQLSWDDSTPKQQCDDTC